MQPLSRSPHYTAAEVARVLHAAEGARELTYRFDVLDLANRKIGELDSVTEGRVANNAFADIKRQLELSLIDATSLDFLSDRVMPFARLVMPKRDKVVPQPVTVQWTERRRNLVASPAGPGDAEPSASDWRAPGSLSVVIDDGQAVIQATENVDSSPLYLDPSANYSPPVGATIRFSVDVKTNAASIASAMRLRFSVYNGATVTNPMLEQAIVAEQWTHLTITAEVTAMPSGAYVRTIVWPSGNARLGDWIRVRNAVFEAALGAPLLADTYFDGGTASVDPLVRYRWLGTPGRSESVYEVGERIYPPPLVIPDERPGFVEWPLGVFLLESPDRELRPSGVVSRTVKGHDQLIVLADDRMPTRRSFAAGTRYTDAVKTLAEEAGITTAIVNASSTMPTALEWEPGTSRLRAVNDLLSAVNYESAWFDELGRLVVRPYLSPAERSPEYRYATDSQSVIASTGLSQTLDVFGVANEWTLIVSEADRDPIVATYTNNNPASPTSTVARGRTISDFRDNEEAPDLATLQAKAQRLAFEASQVIERASFETLAMPFHSNSDVLELVVPRLGLKGVFSEHSWELPLKAGARMQHTVRRVVTV